MMVAIDFSRCCRASNCCWSIACCILICISRSSSGESQNPSSLLTGLERGSGLLAGTALRALELVLL